MRSNISVIFISILIFWLLFAPKTAIIPDTTVSGWVSNAVSLILMGYVCYDMKYLPTGRCRTFDLLLLAYIGISVYSVYCNIGTIHKFELEEIEGVEGFENTPRGATSVKYLLYHSVGLLASCLYIQRIADTRHIKTLLRTFIILFLIVLIPACIEVILTPIDGDDLTEYSFGNKFTLGYYFVYLCTLYYFLHPDLDSYAHKLCLLFLILAMILTSIIAQCSTMIFGALIFLFLSLLTSDYVRNYLASAKTVILSVLLFDIGFFLFATWILQYDFVQYFIQDVLNEDLTLTGRIHIYMDIQEAFTESPWIGLGYGNSMVISRYFTDAMDSQNGLVELFIQVGVIGVAVFLLLLYASAKTSEENNIPKYPLVAFIYTIFGISIVEIPFKHSFIFFLSFCFIQKKRFSPVFIKYIQHYIRYVLNKMNKNHYFPKEDTPMPAQ